MFIFGLDIERIARDRFRDFSAFISTAHVKVRPQMAVPRKIVLHYSNNNNKVGENVISAVLAAKTMCGLYCCSELLFIILPLGY